MCPKTLHALFNLQVYKVLTELLVLKDHKDYQDHKVKREREDSKDSMAQWVHRVLQELLATAVRRERKE